MTSLRSFNMLMLFTMIIYISIGIGTVFTTYFMEYYFELSETEMAILPLASGIGGLVALVLTPIVGKRLDKKSGIIFSIIIAAVGFSMPFNLRILGLYPANGSSLILPSYFLSIFIGYTLFLVVGKPRKLDDGRRDR